MPEGITSAHYLPPSPLMTCASSVWRLLSQPSEIHSATGRINKLSTWLSGRMQAGGRWRKYSPQSHNARLAQRRTQHLPGVWRQWNNTTQAVAGS